MFRQMTAVLTRRAAYGARSPRVGARGATTRQRLLDAALGEISRRGYFATRIEDIAATAGTSRATLYQYFADKDEVAVHLLRTPAAHLRRSLRRLDGLGPGPEGRTSLRAWLVEVTAIFDHHGPALAIWAAAEGSGGRLGRAGSRYLRRLAAELARRLRRAGVDDLDPLATAVAVLAVVERVQHHRLHGPLAVSGQDTTERLADVLHAMLFPAQSPAPPR